MDLDQEQPSTPGSADGPPSDANRGSDPAQWRLESLLNAQELQSLMDDFAKVTQTVTAILDLEGRVLVAAGWQDICTRFHRAFPPSACNCTESDLYLAGRVRRGAFAAYKCKNGLWDVVTPLFIADTHMGNIYSGQFLYADEEVDRAFFEAQAEAFGYDRAAYLEALDRVPRFSRDQVNRLMEFLVKFTDLVSRVTLTNLRSTAFIREQARSAAALRASEAALRDSQTMLALVLDTIPQSVFWKDLNGTYLGCNATFARTAGLANPGQVVGRTDYQLPWLREEAEAFRADDRDVLESGTPKLRMVEPLHAADGSSLVLETSKVPLKDAGDRTFGVLGIYDDITELSKAEADRTRLQAQLQQIQKMESLGNLAGGVAHDINNVLGAILAVASTHLEAQPQGSPVRLGFETIIKAAERGGKMVKSLLSFARKTAAEWRPLDLNRILQEEAALLERTTLSRIRIDMELAPDLWPIQGDESALAHAIMNLCVNAVDAMTGQGALTLRSRNLGDRWVEVQVRDTGAGMPKEVLERAMEPFFTTKEVGRGTGLGLSTVYSTVQAHHGQIDLQSAPGQGTCVQMRFPAFRTGEVLKAPARAGGAAAGRRLRVLLIDDDELIQASMDMLLQSLGHTVVPARCGEQGLALLQEGVAPDLVILDMNMPGLNGAATLERLRARLPHLPVLLATGRVDQAALDLIRADAHTLLLAKPFAMADLVEKIEAALKPD